MDEIAMDEMFEIAPNANALMNSAPNVNVLIQAMSDIKTFLWL